ALGWLRETTRETPTLTSVGTGGQKPGSTSFDEAEALELYERGHSDTVVADELGVSAASVAQLRAREQLPPNGTPVKTVEQPEQLTEDLAELVGLWVGDGSAHEDGVRFHVGRESVADYIDELSRQLFGTPTSVSFAEGCYEVRIDSHEIKRWWETNFDCKPDGAQSARVPQAVKRAPAAVVRAFLRGYFTADGTLLDDTYPKLYSSSERAIDDVATLMMGLGYPVKKSVVRDEDAHPYYGLVPTTGDGREAFLREVGFVDERREIGLASAESVTARDSHTVGEEYTVTVDAVTESDPATVYDITVADNHEYVTDGIVSHNSGGGMGYAFWKLRPYGDTVGSTGGIASGPITFMRTYDQLCETIAQGGARRGAQMGVMRVSHPDVIQFIHAKNKDVSLARSLRLNDPDDFTHTSFADALEEARGLIDDDGKVPEHLRNAVEGHLSNFNISVGITNDFMEAVKNDEEFTFTNPRTEEPHVATPQTKELYDMFGMGEHVEVGEVLSVPAAELWTHIVEGAHENGEPGVIYLERVNEMHSFDVEEHPDHRILATNPCFTGDTEVLTGDGESVPMRTLADRDEVTVAARTDDTPAVVSEARAENVRRTREDAEIVRVVTEQGPSVECTPDHEFWTGDGYRAAADLTPGDTVRGTTTTDVTFPAEHDDLTVAYTEPAGTADVYDLEVPEHHNFHVAGDGDGWFNVHNCGEQPLEEYEACNLGHINLSTLAATDAPDWRVWSEGREFDSLEDGVAQFLEEAIDWTEFDDRIEVGTRFLENVVTMSDFPVEEISETVAAMRKIGLGIMGLAQLYVQLGVKYGDDVANEIARQLMVHINHESKTVSHELAQERGPFDEWDKSKYADPTAYAEWFEHHTGEDPAEWEDGYPIRNHNTTTIAPTGCVEENSLVSTDEGLREISDLDQTTAEFEQWDEIDVGVTTDGGTKSATAVYDNGFDEVREIETEAGFGIAATPSHRFRTITDDGAYAWKEADAFEPGDRILLQRDTFDGGSRVPLDTSERENYYRNTDSDLQLPEEMSPDLAEFLGYFVGDGYVHDGVGVKLVVESEATELDEHLRELGQRLFGVTPTVEDRDTRHVLTFGGRHLPRYFEANGWKKDDGNHGEGAASAFVPEEVLRGDEAVAKSFLRGLFEADGTASRKVELSTVSSTLADQVQTLLLSLGCVFVRDSLEMEDVDDHYGDRPRHSVRGANKREDQRFLDEIGFVTKSTAFDLDPQSYRNDTYPPSVVDHLRAVDGYDSVSKPVKKRVNQSPINGSVSRKLVRDVEAETGETVRIDGRELTDFYAATVESVTDGTAYTKDISVPSNNTYVANGFVTHNTTSMVGNTTGGCEPIYNVAYYKNVSDDVQGDEMLVEFDDYFLRTLEANDIDVTAVKREAQEQMANNEFDGVDGLETVPDAIGELFVVTGDLDARDHAGVQISCQEGVDSAISKCLEAGTLVQTDAGVRRIESFGEETPEPDEFVEVEEDVTIDGVQVESQYYAGDEDATRVRVDNGTEIVGATHSHRVLTPDGWQILGELEPGDQVVGRHVESHGSGGTVVSFDAGVRSVHEKDASVPTEMSPRLARFLGMYAADGSAVDSRYSVEISTSSERVRAEVVELFEELFGCDPFVEADTRGGDERDTVYNVGVNAKLVWEFVTELCGSGSYEKSVPHEVLVGSPEEKIAFAEGVTLDGYVTEQSLVVYGGMSQQLADGVAELLRSFGVPKVYVGRKWVEESDAYSYQVHVTNDAQELVTPVEPHKRVDRFDQQYRVYVPEERVDKTEYYSRSEEYYAARSFEHNDRNSMFDTTAEKLGITDAPPLYEVTDVEDAGTREMYDIELAGPHEYVVGGVVSHNTVNAPNSSTVEDAQEVFEY
ncbi:MAG: LAGLIDADG family homing endonuclease, partial [Halobaculum sp.]